VNKEQGRENSGAEKRGSIAKLKPARGLVLENKWEIIAMSSALRGYLSLAPEVTSS
jgi:hypothetical protein